MSQKLKQCIQPGCWEARESGRKYCPNHAKPGDSTRVVYT